MTVYVDDVVHNFGRMKMYHMWADDLEELLVMADRLGLRRDWLQGPPKASWLHFDVSLTKKALAIAAGAVLIDKYGPLDHLARLDVRSGDPQRIARGERKLQQIARARAMAVV